jgi:hypothetical protein
VAAAIAIAAVAACGQGAPPVQAPMATGSTVSLPADAQAPPVAPREPVSLASVAGQYSITGSMRSDTCGGAVYLAANAIEVVSSGLLRANVVNRQYDAVVDGDRLVADGSFPARTGCDGDLVEHWTFDKSPEGLDGELTSEWPLPPRCARCRVVFAIHASRVDAASGEGPGARP